MAHVNKIVIMDEYGHILFTTYDHNGLSNYQMLPINMTRKKLQKLVFVIVKLV